MKNARHVMLCMGIFGLIIIVMTLIISHVTRNGSGKYNIVESHDSSSSLRRPVVCAWLCLSAAATCSGDGEQDIHIHHNGRWRSVAVHRAHFQESGSNLPLFPGDLVRVSRNDGKSVRVCHSTDSTSLDAPCICVDIRPNSCYRIWSEHVLLPPVVTSNGSTLDDDYDPMRLPVDGGYVEYGEVQIRWIHGRSEDTKHMAWIYTLQTPWSDARMIIPHGMNDDVRRQKFLLSVVTGEYGEKCVYLLTTTTEKDDDDNGEEGDGDRSSDGGGGWSIQNFRGTMLPHLHLNCPVDACTS